MLDKFKDMGYSKAIQKELQAIHENNIERRSVLERRAKAIERARQMKRSRILRLFYSISGNTTK